MKYRGFIYSKHDILCKERMFKQIRHLIIQEFRYFYSIKSDKTYLICCSWRMFYTGGSSCKKGSKYKKSTNQQVVNFPKWKEWTGSHPDSIHHDFQLAPFYKLAAIYEQGQGICNIKWITAKTITGATKVRSNKHTDYMKIMIWLHEECSILSSLGKSWLYWTLHVWENTDEI